MKKYSFKLLVLFTTLFVSNICSAVKLEIVADEWRPYNYLEEGEVKGVSSEVVKKVMDRSGLDYNITILPWTRAYDSAQKKENHLIYTIIRIPNREKLFKWIRPLGKGGKTSLYRLKKNNEVAPKTIDEAKNFRVIASKDTMDHIWLVANGFNNSRCIVFC